MEQDSTITKGSVVPVVRERRGKKINLITTNKKIRENIQPFRESSFQTTNQNL